MVEGSGAGGGFAHASCALPMAMVTAAVATTVGACPRPARCGYAESSPRMSLATPLRSLPNWWPPLSSARVTARGIRVRCRAR